MFCELADGISVVDHPIPNQRPCNIPDVDFRGQGPRDAFGHEHVLLQQEQIGLQAHVKGATHRQQLTQQAREGNALKGLIDDGFGNRSQGQRKGLRRGCGGQVAFFGIALGQAVVIAFEQVGHEISEKHPAFPVQPPDDAKIDKNARRRARR